MSKHYYIESDRIVSKIGGGMELNIVPLDTCMYAFNIEDIDDYKDKSVANSKMMYRHFDSTLVEDEVLVEANFGWLNDCAYTNYTEKDIYFYHKDHLGSSNQITDKDAVVIHHIEYMPSGEQFAEQRSTWGTSYKFNSKFIHRNMLNYLLYIKLRLIFKSTHLQIFKLNLWNIYTSRLRSKSRISKLNN